MIYHYQTHSITVRSPALWLLYDLFIIDLLHTVRMKKQLCWIIITSHDYFISLTDASMGAVYRVYNVIWCYIQ